VVWRRRLALLVATAMMLVATLALAWGSLANSAVAAANDAASCNGLTHSNAEPGDVGRGTRVVASLGQQGDDSKSFTHLGKHISRPDRTASGSFESSGSGPPGKWTGTGDRSMSCTITGRAK
jgi:hypothetical protein